MEIEGIVQGVGFRPFVYRLAHRLGLSGWVRNTGRGVLVQVEGARAEVNAFCFAISHEAPPLAVISNVNIDAMLCKGGSGFSILESATGTKGGEVPPDCDVCEECLTELLDPSDRRYLYPFINCTNCGPRYSIITGIPYDRPATTMAPFAMCDQCLAEYHDPLNRRFHAQPNACPVCGPRLALFDSSGASLPGDPLTEAIQAVARGMIVAVKGVGGYHLAVDALSEAGVARLRLRKKRDEKPFALLAADLESVRRFAHCSDLEARLLSGGERPIVLLKKFAGNPISPLVAPKNGWFGVMLPGNPLQHLLLQDGAGPLVMTSGNLSDEPIAYRDAEAMGRLSGIADLFLSHNREIHTRTDDSVLRLYRGEPLFLRRSRGYVPRAVSLPARPLSVPAAELSVPAGEVSLPAGEVSVLAVGAELKGAVCLTRGTQAFMSQHIGDLKNSSTLDSMQETVEHLGRLLQIAPRVVAHDLHPDYLSTHYAESLELPRIPVQHHHAHMASCMAENGLVGEVIGVIFDGTGYGLDGAIWGGEFLLGGYAGFKRCGHFSYLRMPGGDAAVREPYRMAISALYQLYGKNLFEQSLPFLSDVSALDQALFLKMLERGINSPLTSSCGRLFDAVAALIGVRNSISYEGQAAIELEALAECGTPSAPYPYLVHEGDCRSVDFGPMFSAICADLAGGREAADIARAFHQTIAEVVVDLCKGIRGESGIARVVLSGGVFQNRLLTEEVADLLVGTGFQVYCHRLVPPNDGGLALGQAVIAGHTL